MIIRVPSSQSLGLPPSRHGWIRVGSNLNQLLQHLSHWSLYSSSSSVAWVFDRSQHFHASSCISTRVSCWGINNPSYNLSSQRSPYSFEKNKHLNQAPWVLLVTFLWSISTLVDWLAMFFSAAAFRPSCPFPSLWQAHKSQCFARVCNWWVLAWNCFSSSTCTAWSPGYSRCSSASIIIPATICLRWLRP